MQAFVRCVVILLLACSLCSEAEDSDQTEALTSEKSLYAQGLKLAHEKPLSELQFKEEPYIVNAWRLFLDGGPEIRIFSCYVNSEGAEIKYWRMSKEVKDEKQLNADVTRILASRSKILTESQTRTLTSLWEESKLFAKATKKKVIRSDALDGMGILVEAKGRGGYVVLDRSNMFFPTAHDAAEFQARDLNMAAAIFYLLGLMDEGH